MIENISKKIFFHSGYPLTWRPQRNHLYALFSQQHDCFIYVTHDLDLIRRVQFILSSKVTMWIYELWMPIDDNIVKSISNDNCEEWTLQQNIDQPRAGTFVNKHDQIQSIDCTSVNILGQLSGIELKPNAEVDKLLHDLRCYALFCGWIVGHLRLIESPHEEIMCRIAMVNAMHVRSTVVEHDLFILYSKIYQALWLSTNLAEVKQALVPIFAELTESTRIGKIQHMISQIIDLESL